MDELGIKKHKLEVGEKVTELFKPTKYSQTSSNTPEDTSVDEGQGLCLTQFPHLAQKCRV